MPKKRITELTEATSTKTGHFIPVDHGTDGTQKMSLETLFSDIEEDLNGITESTRNLNTSLMGRYGNASDGKIYDRNTTYWGMSTFIPVIAGESYTVSNGGLTSSSTVKFTYLFVDDSGNVVERAGYQNNLTRTLLAPTGATKLNVFYYSDNEITVSDDTYVQIELGTSATDYIEPYTAIDHIARENIENLPEAFNIFSVIDNTADLNSLTSMGAYRWNSSSPPNNSPVAQAARLLNVPSDANNGAGWIQIVITADTVMYIRYKITTNWSNWVQVSSTDEMQSYVDERFTELTTAENELWEV